VKIVRGLEKWSQKEPVGSVALGFFDGVHRGHQKIITSCIREARRRGLPSVVLTFEPHPLTVIRPEVAPQLITTFSEKARLIKVLGVDELLVVHFTHTFAALPARDFLNQTLVGTLRAKHVTVGYSYTFGHSGEGNAALLADLGPKLGLSVTVISPVEVEGQVVSSSLIRELLAQGELKQATLLLGRPPAVTGRVVPGAKRGRTLGFPTANIELRAGLALPKLGVYAVRVCYAHRSWPAVANLGRVPTFGGDGPARLEVHFLNFHENIYGERLRVEFIDFLRAEQCFSSTLELRQQVQNDIKRAEEILEKSSSAESDGALFTTTGVCDRI
jgi:riboflavin kinase/FMN adenylyltransferase